MKMATKKKSKPAKNKTKKGAQIGSRIGLFFKVFLLTGFMTAMAVFFLFYMRYGRVILKMQKEAKNYVWSSTEDTFRQYQTSIFFDRKGEVISTLSGERELYYVKYEDIPTNVIDAIVTIEDKRYFQHEGVDFIANVRAAVALIQNEGKVTQGASTITQQLARNIFLTNEVTMERKIKEIFIASEMEKKYTKQQILEFYLNNIYYANGYYGIQAAARGYFGKSISELSLSEAAFLCAIPNSPTLYNPVTNSENTYTRRNKILSQMYEDGLIGQKQYKKAVKEEVELIQQNYTINNYVETYVYQCTIEALMEQEGFVFYHSFETEEIKEAYSESYQELYHYYQGLLYTGGYRVYTSIDLSKQEELQSALDQNLAGYTQMSEDGIYQLQGSAVCMDNETGKVVAIVGGRSQEFNSYTLNRAYQSYRQPGSAIKPLIVYTPYFEIGHNPDEVVLDEKADDGPRNSNGRYAGEISLRTAIEQSKNTIAWKLFEQLTPKKGLSYLKQMDFKKLSSKDEVLAASLGGFTYGTNTLEMAAAYLTLENDGVYRRPTCIVRIMNAKGETVIEVEDASKQVYDAGATRIMTDVLTGVFTEGTGKGLGLSGMVAAGKTGTTSDKKDGWFVGYTPYYTTAVWVGYDYPKTMSDLYGNTYPGFIWHDFMEGIHKGLEPAEFLTYVNTWSEEPLDESEEEIEDENGFMDEITTPSEDNPVQNEDSNKKDELVEESMQDQEQPSADDSSHDGDDVTSMDSENQSKDDEKLNGDVDDTDSEQDQKEEDTLKKPLEEDSIEKEPDDLDAVEEEDVEDEYYDSDGNSTQGGVPYSNGQVYDHDVEELR